MKPTFELYDFVMEDAIKDRGIKKCGVIHFARRANGSWIDIPVMIASGKKDGPILLVDACHHGDEHEGAEGIIRVFNSIDPQKMRGTLVAIPVLNVDAFAELRRYGTQDMVPLDLNRSYPGNDTGSLTKCIADFYFTRFIKKATAVITIHGGGNYLYLEPITDYMHCGDEVSRISQEMAEAFGIEKLWQIDESEYDPKNGIMDENAYSVQVPVIFARETVHNPHVPCRAARRAPFSPPRTAPGRAPARSRPPRSPRRRVPRSRTARARSPRARR